MLTSSHLLCYHTQSCTIKRELLLRWLEQPPNPFASVPNTSLPIYKMWPALSCYVRQARKKKKSKQLASALFSFFPPPRGRSSNLPWTLLQSRLLPCCPLSLPPCSNLRSPTPSISALSGIQAALCHLLALYTLSSSLRLSGQTLKCEIPTLSDFFFFVALTVI